MAAATQSAESKPILSRVGKRPVVLPKGVSVSVGAGKVDVQGPKGKLSQPLPPTVSVTQSGDRLVVTSSAAGRDGARWQGLARALIASTVKGAAEGYEKVLELVGTGYRCEVKANALHLALGLSHPVVYPLPAGVT